MIRFISFTTLRNFCIFSKKGKYSTNMFFDRRCPGNACCERYFHRNRRQRDVFMNPAITGPSSSGGDNDNEGDDINELATDVQVESCPLMTLWEVIETAWGMSSESSGRPASIALLKLDVEGAEWEALCSLRDERHWGSILQIVVEVAQCVCRRCRGEVVEGLLPTGNDHDDGDHDHDDTIADIQQLLTERGFKVLVDYNPWGWNTVTGNVMVYATRICF